MKKAFLIIIGCITLILGSLGIIIPGLPTTPFLLLSAWCFAQSSEKFHNWLLNHKILGLYIREYMETGGVRLNIKLPAILFMWLGLSFSLYSIDKPLVLFIIGGLVLFGTVLLLFIIPTAPVKSQK